MKRRIGAFPVAMVWAAAVLASVATLPVRAAQAQDTAAQTQTVTPSAAPDSQPPREVRIRPGVVAERVPYKPGDICVVCNHPVTEDDVVYAAGGQRVPIHQAELSNNVAWQVQLLFARLQPRGAFLGAENGIGLSRAWFYAGLYILVGLIFAALCAHRALHTGHSPPAWFGIGLVLSLAGYLLLLTRPRREVTAPGGIPRGLHKISATYPPQPCTSCGTLNHPSAAACAGCGAQLEPRMTSEVARVGLRSM